MTGVLVSLVMVAVDLDTVRAQAQAQAVAIEVARAQADARGAQVDAVRAAYLPAVAGFVTGSTGAGQTSFGIERPQLSQVGLGVSASYTVVDPAGWAAAQAARRSFMGQEAMVGWAEVEARRQATTLYAQLLSLTEEVAALEDAHADAVALTAAVQSLVQAGLRVPADLARARADEALVLSRLRDAGGQRASRCAELSGLLRAEVACTLDPVTFGEPAEGGEHPALRAASEAVEAAHLAHRAATLARVPTLSADGQVAEYIVSSSAGVSTGIGWNAQVSLAIPLVRGGAIRAASVAADAEARQAQAALDGQRWSVQVARVGAEERLAAARASAEALEVALQASTQADEMAAELYQAGIYGIADRLAARRAVLEASVSLARARGEVGAAFAAVEAARGVR